MEIDAFAVVVEMNTDHIILAIAGDLEQQSFLRSFEFDAIGDQVIKNTVDIVFQAMNCIDGREIAFDLDQPVLPGGSELCAVSEGF